MSQTLPTAPQVYLALLEAETSYSYYPDRATFYNPGFGGAQRADASRKYQTARTCRPKVIPAISARSFGDLRANRCQAWFSS